MSHDNNNHNKQELLTPTLKGRKLLMAAGCNSAYQVNESGISRVTRSFTHLISQPSVASFSWFWMLELFDAETVAFPEDATP